MSKAETRSTVLLKHHRKALKLPTMHGECEAIAARCARENVDHPGFLLQLCERELLERKPGALDFAAPLRGWELPVCFGVLRRRLEAEFGGPGTRRFIKVLRLLEWASPRDLTRAVGRALELGLADADAVRLILEHRGEEAVDLFCLDGRPHLKVVTLPVPDLSAYASLAAGVAL